ncbi:MAG TPA: Gfo/Idh/MocA family oxidoreductase [Oceanipulchritudo sp.]|nr:Gfo/Idh/MocA family oxidoreductase [Oceanipulchritudo sp.]
MTITAGIIGISGYGKVHLDQLLKQQAQGRVRLAAATVINREETAALCAQLEAGGCRIYADYREMLAAHAGELDLCCVPTAIHWHERMTVDCLRAGANVLVEKPLVSSLEEVASIQAAERESGRFVAVGFQNAFAATTHEIKRRINEGEIGKVERLYGSGVWPRHDAYYARNNWAGKLTLDGRPVLDSPVNNAMAHYLHWLLFVAGKEAHACATPVSVSAELYRARGIESFDTANFRVMTADNLPIRFVVSHAGSEIANVELVIQGSEGRFIWRHSGDGAFIWDDGRTETLTLPSHQEMQHEVIHRVVERIVSGTGFICTVASAEMHTRCVVAAHQAFPIKTIPSAFVREVSTPEGRFIEVQGIVSAVRQAAEGDYAFNQLGVHWAGDPPEAVSVRPA